MIQAEFHDIPNAFVAQASLGNNRGIPVVRDYGDLVYLDEIHRRMPFHD
ncbi:hypothetical protein MFUM_680020 [Methylacidiphilum fumariolicum SolV]|uniref:Uncharacterized protein n=2 Tax=Candidatus Methylacidiphilum fumarolicum TaxID=591154 RepID=I0JYN4_METFB|nr:conserved protein of unknown function [Candidatus Methylacidiphilum fumarolicum]CCG92353.1 hypothetical protein MFUM_680020 [Methylacidiphilum fumariolicum SolV]